MKPKELIIVSRILTALLFLLGLTQFYITGDRVWLNIISLVIVSSIWIENHDLYKRVRKLETMVIKINLERWRR